MSRKPKRKISTFWLIATLTFYNLHFSLSLGEGAKLKTLFGFPASRHRVESDNHQKARQTPRPPGGAPPSPARSALPHHRSQLAGLGPLGLDLSTVPKQREDPDTYVESRASELFGNVSELRDTTDEYLGYQADDPGFQEIHEGNAFDDRGPTRSAGWQAMRPLVQCDDTIMTLTAGYSGQGYSQLFVDREGDFPISVFHLPPNCGYSVKASGNDLVVEAPYDGCYITQENGSYVLPVLWWDSPLKVSCPVSKTQSPPPFSPSVPWALCTPYGVAVHLYATDQEMPTLGTIVKDDWAPLVSAKCAYRTEALPGHLLFYIPLSAPCLEAQDGLHLRLLKGDQEFSLSCRDPSSLPPLLPVPPPVTPSPTETVVPPPPRPTAQGLGVRPPDLLKPTHPGLQLPQLPVVDPPAGPQLKRPSPPSPDGAAGPQPQYSGPGQQQFPSRPPPSPPQKPAVEPTSGSNVDPVKQYPKWPPQHGLYQYDPYALFYGSQVAHQAPVPSAHVTSVPPPPAPPHTPPMVPYDQQYPPQHHQRYQLPRVLSQAPQSPGSIVGPAVPAPPQQLVVPQQPAPDSQHYGDTLAPSQPPPTTTTTTLMTMGAKQPAVPNHKRPTSRCPHNNRTFCGSHPVPPHVPPSPALTYPPPPPPTSAPAPVMSLTPQPPAPPSAKPPRLRCLGKKMTLFLPSPDPDSIQVRVLRADSQKAWLPLSSVPRRCRFLLLPTTEAGLVFESPLPACHSQRKTPTTLALRLRFWDVSLARKRILELQCPYRPPLPGTPAKGPPVPPDRPAAGRVPAIHRPRAASRSPPPPPPPPSSYLPLVSPVTQPGVSPLGVPSHGCSIPEDQRLPCGAGALTQPQCLSLGCCFNEDPPACHYPMDECTLDRHFVFAVPSSLTDPPLAPALLVTAGDPPCKPSRVTARYALFRIPVDSCAARRMVLGKTLIYILEIVNKVESITLDRGTITRDSPVRILVECRYTPGPSSVTTGYMTKIPSLGPGLPGRGVFGVQLRIARDARYASFHPQHHVPLRMLLGEPLYLEVRLVSPPDPQLVLLVHYCVAYPRSGEAMWVLLYKECPNPFDPAAHNAVLPSPESQTRRFSSTTFQFLRDDNTYDLDQEIYFMCSTEACVSQHGPCVEGCLGQ